MDGVDYKIRAVTFSDRSRLANLIHFGSYVHQHLDWKPPLDWIGKRPYLMAERDSTLLAALACPPELPDIAWVRLFAVSTNFALARAWNPLWEATIEELAQMGQTKVAALSLQGWFNETLEGSNFEHTDNVVVLMWENSHKLPKPKPSQAVIRSMVHEDLKTIQSIDNSAFGFEWRNSIDELELAFQQATLASVAEQDGEIIGYQYSTSSMMGGHLARLAVKTSMQGKGIGYLLVHDLLTQFNRQGVQHVTVNTQQNNSTSLALYAKAGFSTTGESYRVYQYTLP